MSYIVFFLLVALIIISWLIVEDVSYHKFLKYRRSMLTEGCRIVYYACINDEFNDWKKIGECTITDCRENTFKVEWENGDIQYIRYDNFGAYDDKVEVYDGDKLVFKTGFVPFSDCEF